MAGRPKFVIDEKVIAEVEKLAGQGLTEKEIALCIGCSQETLIKKKRQYSEFSEAIKRGKAKSHAKIANALFENALAGNTAALIFYLKTRHKEQWNEKPQEVPDRFKQLSEDEVDTLIAAYEREFNKKA